jgi:Metallo-peptidase family M12B Reprolysin-like
MHALTQRKRIYLLAICLLCCGGASKVRAQDPLGLWQEISDVQAGARLPLALKTSAKREIVPQAYRTVTLDKTAMSQLLGAAPEEFAKRKTSSSAPEITLPLPQGGYGRFSVLDSPLMEPALAAQFPEIKNYVIQGVDDPTATGRIDTSPKGFRAMVISQNGTFFIDPYWSDSDAASIVYAKEDFADPDKLKEWSCGVAGNDSAIARTARTLAAQARPTGATLRVYRAAIAAAGEYTAFHGGTVALALAAINTTLARVNTVYERDFCIRMILVANNTSIIYTDAATDPYTNGDPDLMIDENQTNVDSVIGNANYDIGHVFGTDSGGLAGLGVVCETGAKAQGVTGSDAPVNDPFDIDYVAHEMGHQFAGNHTFNGTSGAAAGGNRNASTAFEPGSGSTVMAYAGICAPQDLQATSDDYFQTGSYTEIDNYTSTGTGAGAFSNIPTGNSPPVIGSLSSYTIPAQTPFALAASATEPDGDALTYCWEEYDLGPAQNPLVSPRDNGSSTIFRSYKPTTNTTRFFPSLSYVLNNSNNPPSTYVTNGVTNATGEALPTTSRTMTYRVSVRDNRAGGGSQNWASMQVTTVSAAGPFRVTSPDAAAIIYAGVPFAVAWDVAGTTGAPINCANVRILFSTDGGTNFPVVVASSVPNSGSTSVTITNRTTNGRIKLEAAGNIFFDVNGGKITVLSTNPPGAIANLVAANAPIPLSSSAVDLSWSAAADAAGYRVERNGAVVASNLAVTSYRDIGLSELTSYSYQIVATNLFGQSFSPAAVVTTKSWVNDNPYGFRVTNPATLTTTNATNYVFSGQMGEGLTSGIVKWTNVARATSGYVSPLGTNWSQLIPLFAGTNRVIFSTSYPKPISTNITAYDSAGDWTYQSQGWVSGANGGYGFGPWSNTVTSSAATLAATDQWASTNMKVNSFYGFAFRASAGAFGTARRLFAAPLAVGSSFTINFDSNLLDVGRTVGFSLADSNQVNRFTFFALGGTPNVYVIRDGAGTNTNTGITYTTSGLLPVTFTLVTSNSYRFVAGTNAPITNALVAGGAISDLVASNSSAGAAIDNAFYLGDMSLLSPVTTNEPVRAAAPYVIQPVSASTDGIPNVWWETYFPGNSASWLAANDSDSDGQSNAAEYTAGTSPVDASSKLAILSIDRVGASVVITWSAVVNKVYSVETNASPASTNWQPVPPNVTNSSGATNLSTSVPIASPDGFLRVRLAP